MNPLKDISVESLLKGGMGSFDNIYSEYYERVYHYIYRFIRSRELAEELTADVFIQLWKKRRSVDPQSKVDGLIFKIAHDFVVDQLRRLSRTKALKDKWIQNYHESISNTIEEHLFFEEELTRVRGMIETLPDKRKLVFKMRFQQNMTNDQIARSLEISPNTVKVHLTRASNQIRKYISNGANLASESLLFIVYFFL